MNERENKLKEIGGCSCHLVAPCGFCTELTYEEEEAYKSGKMGGLISYWKEKEAERISAYNKQVSKLKESYKRGSRVPKWWLVRWIVGDATTLSLIHADNLASLYWKIDREGDPGATEVLELGGKSNPDHYILFTEGSPQMKVVNEEWGDEDIMWLKITDLIDFGTAFEAIGTTIGE